MTEQLPFHFSLSCIGEGNGNPLQCSCLENPRDGGAWWAAVYGVAQSQTQLKRLSSSSSSSLQILHFVFSLLITQFQAHTSLYSSLYFQYFLLPHEELATRKGNPLGGLIHYTGGNKSPKRPLWYCNIQWTVLILYYRIIMQRKLLWKNNIHLSFFHSVNSINSISIYSVYWEPSIIFSTEASEGKK